MYFVNCSKKTDVMLVFLLFLKNTPYNLQWMNSKEWKEEIYGYYFEMSKSYVFQ